MPFDPQAAGVKWGWRDDIEDRHSLKQYASAMPALMMGPIPEVVDPRQDMIATGWLPRNQGGEGSCQGNSLATNIEVCHYIATGGQLKQFSSDACYYKTQEMDGIQGDKGSTIWGGVKMSKEYGGVSEELYPSTQQYDPRPFTNAHAEDGGLHRLYHHIEITSYDQARDWLGGGLGAIHTGQTWKQSLNDAVVDRFSGRGGGGHSVTICGYSARKDNDGRPYMIMCNSWGRQFGNDGFAEWAPRAVDDILRDRNTQWYGLSDMADMQQRPWKYTGEGSLLR